MNGFSRRHRPGQPEADEFLPPDLVSMGALPFGEAQRARLHAWLNEAGWPSDPMGMAELEGYLVALIVWPVDIPSGAWLPPIWRGRGWKLPSKIATRSRYEEFVALIVGFMHELDRDFCSQALFESSVLHGLPGRERASALRYWGRGFIAALSLGSQGLRWRDASARAAVGTIVSSSSGPVSARPVPPEVLFEAVVTLAEQRSSRGPLGPAKFILGRAALELTDV